MIPVQYTPDSQAIVDTFESLQEAQQTADYWSSEAAEPVRREVKNHYIVEQQYLCVYCQRQILTQNMSLWDAEHVISRSKAAQFMFTPKNLAVSCRDCNIAKGEEEVRRNPARKSFPDKSEQYVIVHPHFDTYSEHIRWVGSICVPLSGKGQKTLIVCNLTRFTAGLLGLQSIIVDPRVDQLVGQFLSAKTKVEARSILAGLMVYVENIPQE